MDEIPTVMTPRILPRSYLRWLAGWFGRVLATGTGWGAGALVGWLLEGAIDARVAPLGFGLVVGLSQWLVLRPILHWTDGLWWVPATGLSWGVCGFVLSTPALGLIVGLVVGLVQCWILGRWQLDPGSWALVSWMGGLVLVLDPLALDGGALANALTWPLAAFVFGAMLGVGYGAITGVRAAALLTTTPAERSVNGIMGGVAIEDSGPQGHCPQLLPFHQFPLDPIKTTIVAADWWVLGSWTA